MQRATDSGAQIVGANCGTLLDLKDYVPDDRKPKGHSPPIPSGALIIMPASDEKSARACSSGSLVLKIAQLGYNILRSGFPELKCNAIQAS